VHQIGFDKNFSLLAQEAHLAKNTLLSGFDLLLKANFYLAQMVIFKCRLTCLCNSYTFLSNKIKIVFLK
jgi:hypothetical protein